MTPSGWTSNDLALLGVAWLFGGAVWCVAVGLLAGRWKGSDVGAGTGLMLYGLGHAAVIVLTLAFLRWDTVVLTLPGSRCEVAADARGRPIHSILHAVQRPGEPAHEVQATPLAGTCPKGPPETEQLRVRQDALRSAQTAIRGEYLDDNGYLGVMVMGGALGFVASLGGGLILARHGGWLPARRAPAPVRPVSAARRRAGALLMQLGVLVFLAAFVAFWLLDRNPDRAFQVGLRSVAAALACWGAGGLVGRTIGWGGALSLLCLGGATLGLAELAHLGR